MLIQYSSYIHSNSKFVGITNLACNIQEKHENMWNLKYNELCQHAAQLHDKKRLVFTF